MNILEEKGAFMIHIHAARIDYTENAAISLLAVNGHFWGYGLEEGALIPAGKYPVRVVLDARLGQWVPKLRGPESGWPLLRDYRVGRESFQGRSFEFRLLGILRGGIPVVPGETEAAFWDRLPETWYTLQDGPLAPPV
jgi:hypothetical protein